MVRVKFLCKLILIAIIFPILIVTMPPHQMALGDPKHCQGYNACYVIGYRDGYNDAQNGVSPAYALHNLDKYISIIFHLDNGVF